MQAILQLFHSPEASMQIITIFTLSIGIIVLLIATLLGWLERRKARVPFDWPEWLGLLLLTCHGLLIYVALHGRELGSNLVPDRRISIGQALESDSAHTETGVTPIDGIWLDRSRGTAMRVHVHDAFIPYRSPIIREGRSVFHADSLRFSTVQALEYKLAEGSEALWSVVGLQEGKETRPAFLALVRDSAIFWSDTATTGIENRVYPSAAGELSFALPATVNGVESDGDTTRFLYFDGRCGIARSRGMALVMRMDQCSFDRVCLQETGWQGLATVPAKAVGLLAHSPDVDWRPPPAGLAGPVFAVTNTSNRRMYFISWPEAGKPEPVGAAWLDTISGEPNGVHYYEGGAIVGNGPYWLAVADAFTGKVYLRPIRGGSSTSVDCNERDAPAPLYVEGVASHGDEFLVTSRHGRVVLFKQDGDHWKRERAVDLTGVEHMQDGTYADKKTFIVGNEATIAKFSTDALGFWGGLEIGTSRNQELIACILLLIDFIYVQLLNRSLLRRFLKELGELRPKHEIAVPRQVD